MASGNERKTFDKRVNTSEGHYVKWDVCVRDLPLLREWKFEKIYRTYCETSPTVWDFKMWFPEVREDGTASLSVTLTRADSGNVDLEASVWVDISDPRESLIFPKQTFTKRGMVTGSEIEETVQLEPYPGMAHAVFRNAMVCVKLTISSCHSKN